MARKKNGIQVSFSWKRAIGLSRREVKAFASNWRPHSIRTPAEDGQGHGLCPPFRIRLAWVRSGRCRRREADLRSLGIGQVSAATSGTYCVGPALQSPNLTPPSRRTCQGRFAPFGPPLMSNVRSLVQFEATH